MAARGRETVVLECDAAAPGVVTVLVAAGADVEAGDVVAELLPFGGGDDDEPEPIRAARGGRVVEILAVDGAALMPGAPVLSVDSCPHEVVIGSLCGQCGRKVAAPTGGASVVMRGGQRAHVSERQAAALDVHHAQWLRGHRKCVLVLDLDHTVLHATHRHPGAAHAAAPDVHEVIVGGGPHWVKLRPGCRQFLAAAAELYELRVYTHGLREYAEVCARLLDPDSTLIGSRIVSRSDTPEDPGTKCLARIFPSDDSYAVVLDDKPRVWDIPSQPSVLWVQPYLFFPGAPEVNNQAGNAIVPLALHARRAEAAEEGEAEAEGPPPPPPGATEADDGFHLQHIMNTLRAVHARFYAAVERGEDPNTSVLLPAVLRDVLAGCVLVFSGIFPKHRSPETQPLWNMAKTFGAQCRHDVCDEMTHLVLAWAGTQKHVQARKRGGVHCVGRQWLEYSLATASRRPEGEYPPPVSSAAGGGGGGGGGSAAGPSTAQVVDMWLAPGGASAPAPVAAAAPAPAPALAQTPIPVAALAAALAQRPGAPKRKAADMEDGEDSSEEDEPLAGPSPTPSPAASSDSDSDDFGLLDGVERV